METEKSKAEIYYARHLERLRRYNEANAEKLREKAREQFRRLKADPEKYTAYLEKKKMRYNARKNAEKLAAN